MPDIKGLTIGAGKTQEPEIVFQVPYLNLMGKGLTMALLQNTAQLKADMSFTLTLNVNGETITTTQNLTDENMNGLALGQLGIVSGPRNTKDGRKFNHLIKKATGTDATKDTVNAKTDLLEKDISHLAKEMESNENEFTVLHKRISDLRDSFKEIYVSKELFPQTIKQLNDKLDTILRFVKK
ncbi:MAG: hypothetical protein GQ564_07465 [Bacteroidales bacterium]|nr:hypothetical protein [Bacteroidales bacterium]